MRRSDIARIVSLDPRVVTKYIDEKYNPIHVMYGTKRVGILTPYMKEINTMLEAGITSKVIEEKIRQAGYTGSGGSVRNYIADWRKCRKYAHSAPDNNEQKVEILERKDIFKLLFHPL